MSGFVAVWALRRDLVMFSVGGRDTSSRPSARQVSVYQTARDNLALDAADFDTYLNKAKTEDPNAYNKAVGYFNDMVSKLVNVGVSSNSFKEVVDVSIPKDLPRFVTQSYAGQQRDMKESVSFYGYKTTGLNGLGFTYTYGTASLVCFTALASIVLSVGITGVAAGSICAAAYVGAIAVKGIEAVQEWINHDLNLNKSQIDKVQTVSNELKTCYTEGKLPKEACDKLAERLTSAEFLNPPPPQDNPFGDTLKSLTTLAITLGVVGIGFMLFKSGVFSAGARAIDARTEGYRQLPEGRVVETSLSPMAGLRKRRRVSRRRRYA
jgi:hypothetical protein